MKITDVRTTVLSIPFSRPLLVAKKAIDGVNIILVRLETSEGISGWGECDGRSSPEVVLAAIESIKPLVVGSDPFLVEALLKKLLSESGWGNDRRFANAIISGIEMAVWDLVGKACSQPVSRLMGGAVRDAIDCFGFAQGDSVDELVEQAIELKNSGFTHVYTKIGFQHDDDLRRVEEVCKAVSPNHIRLDANEAWEIGEARRFLRALESLPIEFIEQPLPRFDYENLIALRKWSKIPIAVDQGVFTTLDCFNACRLNLADMIVLGIHECGGLLNFRKASAIAEAAGIPICRHGVLETGVTTAASNQVAAVIQNLATGNQVMHQLLVEDLVVPGSLVFEEGTLAVSQSPGLGIEINEDAVRKYELFFKENGPFRWYRRAGSGG